MTRSIIITLTIFLGICSLAASSRAFHNPQEDVVLFYNIFKDWITQSNKQYGIEEMAVRFFNWKSNFDFVQEHNAREGLTSRLEMNDFADMTAEEFSALHMGLNTDLLAASKKNNAAAPQAKNANSTIKTNLTNSTNSTSKKNSSSAAGSGLPKSVDWRKSSAVSSVKNQGTCGGCYAFASAGALEGLYAIKDKKLTDLSIQQMIDCSEFFGNKGCDGGLMTTTFGYTQMFGVEPESGYQYAAEAGECKQDSERAVFKNNGYEEVPQNDSLALKKAVARQPVAVGIEASSLTVQLFKSGVITSGCEANLNHAVLIVGYDVDKNGQEYWIVKNSWSPKWGLKGYFHIAMGSQNSGMGVCGINLLASYPTL
jgi:C1A family cysteine protease